MSTIKLNLELLKYLKPIVVKLFKRAASENKVNPIEVATELFLLCGQLLARVYDEDDVHTLIDACYLDREIKSTEN